jgi:LmbE family N-acetylglucosaminyl deacetylase
VTRIEELGTVLGIWAHPDDEAFLMAGVMALASDAGQGVACLTATLGAAGETADEARWPRERLLDVRRAELERSLAILGVSDHQCLDLPDGGLADLDASEHVPDLVAAIERVGPDTVITFGPDGMTGHPDHRTISAWAQEAVADAATGARLLFATKTPEEAEAFEDIDLEIFPPGLPPVTPREEAVTIALDDDTLERKVRALEAHASQTSGLIASLGPERFADWVRLEAFRPAEP